LPAAPSVASRAAAPGALGVSVLTAEVAR